MLVTNVERDEPKSVIVIFGKQVTDSTQCSGSIPCARCVAEACQCVYDAKSDRRRKVYTAELEESHIALRQVVATLRFGSPDQISRFISEIQGFQTTQEAMVHVMGTSRENVWEEMWNFLGI